LEEKKEEIDEMSDFKSARQNASNHQSTIEIKATKLFKNGYPVTSKLLTKERFNKWDRGSAKKVRALLDGEYQEKIDNLTKANKELREVINSHCNGNGSNYKGLLKNFHKFMMAKMKPAGDLDDNDRALITEIEEIIK